MQSFLGDGAAVAISPHNSNLLFTVGYGYWNSKYWLMLSRTTDGGQNWRCDTLDSLFRGNAFCYDLSDPQKVYLAGDTYYSNPMFRVSTDLGATWVERRNGLAGSITAIAAVPRNPGMLFCGSASGLFKTTDEGLNWTRKGTFTGVRSIVVDTVTPSVVYAATGTGVYVSTDAGETWTAMNTGLPTTDVLVLALRSGPLGALYCGTNGRGAYVTNPLVAVAEEPGSQAGPKRPLLLAGRVLLIPAELPAAGWRLFDAAGRLVMSLRLGANDISRLSPGVYFVGNSDKSGQLAEKVVVRR